MRTDVHSALAQLRREIDVLHASVLARSRLAAPEIMTSQRISLGADRAVVRTLDPPAAVAPSTEPPRLRPAERIIAESDRIAVPGSTKTGLLQRLIAFVRRMTRALFG
jgi:hypothetical protein